MDIRKQPPEATQFHLRLPAGNPSASRFLWLCGGKNIAALEEAGHRHLFIARGNSHGRKKRMRQLPKFFFPRLISMKRHFVLTLAEGATLVLARTVHVSSQDGGRGPTFWSGVASNWPVRTPWIAGESLRRLSRKRRPIAPSRPIRLQSHSASDMTCMGSILLLLWPSCVCLTGPWRP